MSLLELLTGSVVFAMAAGSSLQLWALAAAATQAQERQQQGMDAADASLLRAEAALRRLAPSAGDCTAAADRLMGELSATPVASGLARHLERSVGGDGVVLRLAVEGVAEPRQRLYVPAALGLCGASPTAPAVPQGGGDGGAL